MAEAAVIEDIPATTGMEATAAELAAKPEPAVASEPVDKPADAKPALWPEEWRTLAAGGDEKAQKALERYNTPADAMKALRSLQAKISAGELRAVTKLPEKATEEDIAAWRKENGVPEKPEAYLENLGDGLVVGEADKPIATSFAKALHGVGAQPEIAKAAIKWYYDNLEAIETERASMQTEAKAKTEDTLRAEWGGEYRANMNGLEAYLQKAGADPDGVPIRDIIMGATFNGVPLSSNPAAMLFLAQIARDDSPAGFVMRAGGDATAKGIDDEIAAIDKLMRTDPAAYYKDAKTQERYRTLLETKEKMSARNKGG